jgi:hypothetical protein
MSYRHTTLRLPSAITPPYTVSLHCSTCTTHTSSLLFTLLPCYMTILHYIYPQHYLRSGRTAYVAHYLLLHIRPILRIISILNAQPILHHYSLHYFIVTWPSYITFTLNITFVLHRRPTFHNISILQTQPTLRISAFLHGQPILRHLLSTLPQCCINTLHYIYRTPCLHSTYRAYSPHYLVLHALLIHHHYSSHYCLVTWPSYITFTLRPNSVLHTEPTFHVISIIHAHPILHHYCLHYSFVECTSYITFTLNITFILHGRPTFYNISVLLTQPTLHFIYISTWIAYT